MNRGILRKTLLEVRGPTLMFAAGMAFAEGLLSFAIPSLFVTHAEQLLQLPFVQRIIATLLGAGSVPEFTPQVMRSFAWVHPVVLAILWSFAIWFCTRVPAGEIDRGTIDIFLSQPVSRLDVMIGDAAVCATAGLLPVSAALVGHLLGSGFARMGSSISLSAAAGIAANMYAMFIALAGLTYLVSAGCDRRGRAVGLALAIVLASFLANFIAQLWPAARGVGYVSVLNYYRPLHTAQSSQWPVGDILGLLLCGVTCWAIGAAIFAKRDLRTA